MPGEAAPDNPSRLTRARGVLQPSVRLCYLRRHGSFIWFLSKPWYLPPGVPYVALKTPFAVAERDGVSIRRSLSLVVPWEPHRVVPLERDCSNPRRPRDIVSEFFGYSTAAKSCRSLNPENDAPVEIRGSTNVSTETSASHAWFLYSKHLHLFSWRIANQFRPFRGVEKGAANVDRCRRSDQRRP